ncbi:MICOS complex subunit MIC60 [Yarrowia sp. B02]|nr:MICOS complex subunit MIC60 [Yarrowia sp. B02]
MIRATAMHRSIVQRRMLSTASRLQQAKSAPGSSVGTAHGASAASGKPPGATFEGAPKQKKKTHKFRNFVLLTTLVGGGAFAGGVYYSLQNDQFQSLFVEYVPVAEHAINYIEEQQLRSGRLKIATPTSKHDVDQSTVRVPKSGATWRAVDSTDAITSAKSASPAANVAKDAASPAPAATSAPAKTAPKSDNSTVPAVHLSHDSDPAVKAAVQTFNDLIAVAPAQAAKQLSAKVSTVVDQLQHNVAQIKSEAAEEAKNSIAKLNSELAKLKASTGEEISSKVSAAEQQLRNEFAALRAHSEKVYHDRLRVEIEATKSLVSSHANNLIQAVEAERQKQYAQEIAARVEAEREGRLAKLKDLQESLTQLQDLALKTEQAVDASGRTAALHLAIAKLTGALKGSEPVALGPYVESIRRAAGDDPLLQAALDSIPEVAQTEGVLTPAQLTVRFKLLEPELRKSSLVPVNAGVAGHLGSLIFSSLLFKKSGVPKGDDVESVLARANIALEQGKLYDAVAEVNTLKGWPRKLASDWLDEGRRRTEIEFLADVIAEEGKLYGALSSKK